MLEWFVLVTHFAQEQRAARELTNQKIRTFLPLARTEHRRPDGLLVAKIKPLFPHYLFVQLRWEKYKPVMSTRGVRGFCGYYEGMDKAPVVPNDVIKELRSQLEEILGLDVVVFGRPGKVEPGMFMRIMFGPFKHHVAEVDAVQGDRVKLLLNLFGIQTPLTLPRDILSREGVSRVLLDQAA